MYLGVDVGGTKTLLAVFDGHGEIVEQARFATPKNYDHWLLEVSHALAHFKNHDYKAAGAGIPVTKFNRAQEIAVYFSNLPWRNKRVQADLENLLRCPVALENDAKVAALSEAQLLQDQYQSVLYITVSTGIGIGLVVDGVINTAVGDGGGRTILLEHDGKIASWEDFAGGRAIAARYGKLAGEIDDKASWESICRDLAKGLIHLIAITQPEVIVIGGSVGAYFDRYGELLAKEIEKYDIPMVTLPKLRKAQRPEEAVIYGCYELAKRTFAHANVD